MKCLASPTSDRPCGLGSGGSAAAGCPASRRPRVQARYSAIGDPSGRRIQILASLTRIRGAKRGANHHRHQATPGHIERSGMEERGTSGRIQHHPAVLRKCLLSSRSRVRVAVGAQTVQVNHYFRNYRRFNDILLAGNHSQVVCRPAYANGHCGDQAELRSGTRAVEAFRHRGANGIRQSRHVVAAFPYQAARSARGHAVGMPPKAASVRRGGS